MTQQQQLQQHYQQPSDFSRASPGFYPTSSKPEQPSSTYNIHYTAVNQYTSNATGVGGYPKDYPLSNYPTPSNQVSQDPPSYEQSNSRSSSYDQQSQRLAPRNPKPGPQPGPQPDPDIFDRDIKPPRSTNVEMTGTRQGSTAPADDQADRYISSSRAGDAYNSGSQRQAPYDISRRSGHRS